MFDYGKKYIHIRRGVGCALLLITGFVFSLQTVASGSDNIEILMNKAQEDGSVKIIVTMNAPAMPDRASMAAQKFDYQLASAVSGVQDRVIDTLPTQTIVTPPRRFTYTAQFAVTVTADGLSLLMDNPDVINISEDIPEPPLLDQSVPHIFPSHATSSYTGNGWAVAILDTGVDKAHSFLSGKVVSEACYSTTDPVYNSTSVCPGGADSSTATDSGLPCNASVNGCAHGTHVGGITAGDGSSFDGVARDAGLIAIQVFSRFDSVTYCGVGNSPCALTWISDQISALNRVYALRSTYNISSINMSLGGGHYTSACDGDSRKSIIDLLKNTDIATIIASGNDGYTNGVSAPGCISSAVTIGATNDTVDDRAWFSNSGPQLDLYAPGVNINSSVPGGGYASWNGTSMATPHVAGAWAVLKQRFPSYTVDQIETAFDNSGVTVTYNSIRRQRIDIDGALGETPSNGLTTVEPCRIVDTREVGGMITADSTRDFYVWGSDGDIQSQGGTGDCGISPTSGAVVLNITSNQAGNNGYLTVYPYDSSPPNASIVNYTPGVTIANATTTPICQPSCVSDITIYSAQNSHVIIDVVGYME